MEPLTVVAGAVATYMIPKALEKIGEKIGESAFEKSEKTIKKTHEVVKAKLQASGTAGLLKRAAANPSETNIQVLEAELVTQMEEDQSFATHLQSLVETLHNQAPSLQSVLSQVRIKGDLELGDVSQLTNRGSIQQSFGQNLGVGGNFKAGNVTQEQKT